MNPVGGGREAEKQTGSASALARAREAGIHRLRIPTPFAVGRVNCYLIEDSPLTLVDTGPNSGKSLDELTRQLAELGYAIEDLELIVISHQHIDHLGLAEILASRSGADVAAIDVLVPFVERYGEDTEADDEFASGLMRRYGIPEDLILALRSVSRSFRAWGSACEVTRPLAEGERLTLRNRALEVQLRPGHSPSDTVFWDAERSILICADHLIDHISSNPLLARPLDGSTERPKSLVRYLGSLARTRELPASILLPGHGDPITDHVALIEERFAFHRRRAAKLQNLIIEQPRTAYELAQELWGNVAVTQAFLTLSEVVGHVDLLVDAGIVREVADGEVVRFEATGSAGEISIPPRP
jgi:glyoxylase-like metal-dependent hydrolase (beta-lactamase superfamily II)